MSKAINILISGGTGCIASETKQAILSNYEINKIVLLSRSSYEVSAQNADQVIHVQADIRNQASITNILEEHNISHVLHAAAIRTTEAQENPGNAIDVNVNGTTSMLEASRLFGKLKRFVFISTAAVYGEQPGLENINEKAGCSASLTYIATKLAAEKLVECYAHSYGIQAIIIRPQILFGPSRGSEGSTAGLSNAIRATAHKQAFTIPFSSRHHLHFTGDCGPFFAQSLLAPFEQQFTIMNLPGSSHSVSEFVNAIKQTLHEIDPHWPVDISIEDNKKPFPLSLDHSLFLKHFPKHQCLELKEAVKRTLIYYLDL